MKKCMFVFLTLIAAISVHAQQRGFGKIEVSVKNDAGNSNKELLYDESHALIIGNSNYTNGWNQLNGVKTDIIEIKKALESLDFSTVVKENLQTKEEFDNVLNDFLASHENANKKIRLLVYYAGHGYSIDGQQGKVGYLIPTSAPEPTNNLFKTKAFQMEQIKTITANYTVNHLLFVFDACFAGTIFSSVRGSLNPEINNKTKNPVIQFVTSGDAGEEVNDLSEFRKMFVDAITNPNTEADNNHDGYVTGEELGFYLSNNLPRFVQTQHPKYGKINKQELSKGDFVFVLQKKNDGVKPIVNATTNEDDNVKPVFNPGKVKVEYGGISINSEIGGTLYINNTEYGAIAANSTDNNIEKLKITDEPYTVEIRGNETFTTQVNLIKDRSVTVNAKSTKRKAVVNKTNNATDLPDRFADSRDGKVYKLKIIGDQTWMAENLAHDTVNGCWAYDNIKSNVTKYGYLYNYETAKNVCPSGWHLPSDQEWQTLETALGMSSSDANSTGYRGAPVGTNLKNTDGWNNSGNGSNQSGFAALPGGYRSTDGTFDRVGDYGIWWSSTAYAASTAWSRGLYCDGASVSRGIDDKAYGFSVRCVRD